jgi:hypothetical protein
MFEGTSIVTMVVDGLIGGLVLNECLRLVLKESKTEEGKFCGMYIEEVGY